MDIITDKGIAIIPGSVSVDNSEFDSIFKEIKLGNYPNPFNPTTNIAFSLSEANHVTLEVYNIKGQKVKKLVDETLPAGNHTIIWNGTDLNNKPVASGIYFYKLKSGKFVSTKKMVLIK
ncbi:MAG: T9SS type A sorting domain-containing protein [Candidatus Cloacimonetes bacterium]|nr:T9SS type A sorting domain-containing protein [Candidatus Cloacimonadota bacterium]